LSGLPVEGIGLDVIQAPKRGLESCGMTSQAFEWAAIRLLLPNKPRGRPGMTSSSNDPAFIKLASIRIWLRANESAP
jgi:hypothetical protein